MLNTKAAAIAAIAALAHQIAALPSHRHLHRSDVSSLSTNPIHSRDAPPFFAKRGLVYNDAGLANTFGAACPSCAWGWNWDSTPNGLDPKYSFVPMLWGDISVHTDRWDMNAEAALAAGSTAMFSFNEPDHVDQAHMTPEQAAASHALWMNKYEGRALIGAPSVTNSGNTGEGLQWLQAFMDACSIQEDGCVIDFCNVHWYSGAEWASTLFDHLENAHNICGGRPIWLTEFAPISSDEQISTFMADIIPQLDAIEYLHAYSYFMVEIGQLMSSPTELSGYGQLYATV